MLLPEGVSHTSLQPADILFPSIDSFLSYDDVDGYSGPDPVAYITAEFADDLFPPDNTFVIGGDDQPNDRAESYSNGLFHNGFSFAFFLRTYPLTDFVSVIIPLFINLL